MIHTRGLFELLFSLCGHVERLAVFYKVPIQFSDLILILNWIRWSKDYLFQFLEREVLNNITKIAFNPFGQFALEMAHQVARVVCLCNEANESNHLGMLFVPEYVWFIQQPAVYIVAKPLNSEFL